MIRVDAGRSRPRFARVNNEGDPKHKPPRFLLRLVFQITWSAQYAGRKAGARPP